MRKQDINYCEKTDKYCYSSEAKAQKAVFKYDDIKRCYYCYVCDSWHTTSIEVDKIKSVVNPNKIASELKRLKSKCIKK